MSNFQKNQKKSLYCIKSIKKAMDLLNCFKQYKELSVIELSKKLNLNKSTVYRILVTLESGDFIRKNEITKKYGLGIKNLELGNIMKKQIEIRSYAFPIMENLARKTQESIDLNIIVNNKRVSIEEIESPHDIRKVIKLGESLPLCVGASGTAILAFLPDNEINKIIERENISGSGQIKIADTKKLMEHLKEIRREGFAISVQERVIGAGAVAAPIFNSHGNVIASLSISGPVTRFSKKKLKFYISLVKESASKISVSLGYI